MFDLSYWPFFAIAIVGAIVANSTGAGGGIVFVPAFNMLGIDSDAIIATSFAIQCFGMTAGTIAWHQNARANLIASGSDPLRTKTYSRYWIIIAVCSIPAAGGVLLGQYVFSLDSADQIKGVFKSFSFLFGISILLTTAYLLRSSNAKTGVIAIDGRVTRVLLIVIGLIGGLITAWLSVGVGELIAVALILLRYPVRFAIGVAVSVSAFSVWAGIHYHVFVEPMIHYGILAFAAPAAAIGGTVAKYLVAHFSPVQVKVFIAIWILLSAVVM
ncbi:MAG: sulfite exporter TauE/SafE family protein [Gammaproteobacteria bacterium]|nr:sulfite exporter TauE/SafE family protein [Gammaproteobacteria bacterium]